VYSEVLSAWLPSAFSSSELLEVVTDVAGPAHSYSCSSLTSNVGSAVP